MRATPYVRVDPEIVDRNIAAMQTFCDSRGIALHPQARIARIWEHHGVVEVPDGAARPRLGERVTVVPNHVCATVNLVDELVAGDEVWPVTARGRNT